MVKGFQSYVTLMLFCIYSCTNYSCYSFSAIITIRSSVTTQVCSPIFQKFLGTCTKTYALIDRNSQQQDGSNSKPGKVSGVGRREVIATSIATTLVVATSSVAANEKQVRMGTSSSSSDLEGIQLGRSEWIPISNLVEPNLVAVDIPISFSTYASRILINYDNVVRVWWENNLRRTYLLPEQERQHRMEVLFCSLSFSVEESCKRFVNDRMRRSTSNDEAYTVSRAFEELAVIFLERYYYNSINVADQNADLLRHIGLLFSQLPIKYQPKQILDQLQESLKSNGATTDNAYLTNASRVENKDYYSNFADLLPPSFSFKPYTPFGSIGYSISFEGSTSQLDDDVYRRIIVGPYMPFTPLKRQRPNLGIDTYALLGTSGGLACSLTHALVIPLDVVKTRLQTVAIRDSTTPKKRRRVIDEAISIVEEGGFQDLLLGSQATIAGYFWYGLTVYPAYFFFKNFISDSLLDQSVALSQENTIAFVAGALAAVIASIGLTPMEACRIRAVADPSTFRSLGLIGTAQYISNENPVLRWRTLFSGFNSLLSRQVIFGSVKFLAFERSCDLIYSYFPRLMDGDTNRLLVTLLSGAFAGALSCIVSQPADSVLTFVARKGESIDVIRGCRMMIEEDGVGSLFRGLQSRCIWAGCIIAGQFLLFDLFRILLRVDGERLSEAFQLIIS